MAGKKGKKSTVPENETKEARFVRVATVKITGILRNLKTIGRLKGSTSAQRTVIKETLDNALQETVDALAGQKPEVGSFKL